MKKRLLILPLLAIALAGCKPIEYTPSKGGQSFSLPPEPVEPTNTIIEFYLNYTYSEEPIYTIDWWLLKPLGECPEAINTVEKIKALAEEKGYEIDPAFPDFMGWSFYGCCLDEENLWDFATDYKQQAVTAIYGIWTSK